VIIPTCAVAVANAFLDLQGSDKSQFPAIDHIKLQTLIYYAQAWWLADRDSKLFSNDIQAWPWGPVIRTICSQFSHYGRCPIMGTRATELVRTGIYLLDFKIRAPDPVNEEIMEYLKKLWETHKRFTGIQLSNATHASGEPWTIVKEHYGSLETNPIIPSDLIRDIFRAKKAVCPIAV
jgi:uncharacterized phage-associated protein